MNTNEPSSTLKAALRAFRKKKVITVTELVSILDCSKKTAKRRLKQWQTYTSYNQNCSYYVLPDIPKFDQYGLWKFNKCYFSKHGDLKRTFVAIVNQSDSGLNAAEMSEILGIPAYTFLSHFKNDPAIQRQKFNGLYVYFSSSPNILEKQKIAREKKASSTVVLELPSDSEAVVILVELIKHPGDTVEQLVRRVRRREVDIGIEKVRNLLVYHGIEKKTLDIFQSKP